MSSSGGPIHSVNQHTVTDSPEATRAFAYGFAARLKAGDVVALKGNLGAGKTQFVKGVGRYLGIEELQVTSPTFTLINEYGGEIPLYHFDCYRLESIEEALEIGMEEYFWGDGVCLIEWPDLVESLLPDSCYHVSIHAIDASRRRIEIE